MNETSEQIQSQIRHTRDDLTANIGELKHRLKAAVDWRTYYERSPGAFLATALGGGALLALATRQGSVRVATLPANRSRSASRRNGPVHASLAIVKGALIGLAVDRAKSLLFTMPPSAAQLPMQESPGSGEFKPSENDGSTVIG